MKFGQRKHVSPPPTHCTIHHNLACSFYSYVRRTGPFWCQTIPNSVTSSQYEKWSGNEYIFLLQKPIILYYITSKTNDVTIFCVHFYTLHLKVKQKPTKSKYLCKFTSVKIMGCQLFSNISNITHCQSKHNRWRQ